MSNKKTHKLVLTAFFLALVFILPFFTGQIQVIGSMLLPMHLPVLLCGFFVGWPYALALGVISPILRSLMFGMPPMFPVAIGMAIEMGVYGFVSGFCYLHSKKKNIVSIYVSLLLAMILGRVAYGLATLIMLGTVGSTYTFSAFIAGAFFSAIPGIILQLVLIPILVKTLSRFSLNNSTL